MEQKKFKSGDVVRLASGGLKMTIEEYSTVNPKFLKCVWFDGDSNLHKDFFLEDTLNIEE